MRVWPLVGVLTLAACGSPPAATPSPSLPPWSAAEFEAVELNVMQALDEAPADIDAAAIAMEKQLAGFVERAAAADDAGQLTTDQQRESAGLALVYGGMYVLHDAHLVAERKITAARLYAERRYDRAGGSLADAAAVHAETTARQHRAFELFTRAQRLRPKDGRIASWIAAAGAHEHSLPDGEPADADKGKLLAAVEVDPLFNLFTAMILMRHEPLDSPRGRALFDRTQVFLQAQMCKDVVPGTKQERYCRDTPRAPWNEEAATAILADLYMRRGEDALRRGDVPAAMPLLGMAKGILGSVDDEAHRKADEHWKFLPFLEARRKRLAALAPGQPVPDPSFWRSEAFESMYTCAACHVK